MSSMSAVSLINCGLVSKVNHVILDERTNSLDCKDGIQKKVGRDVATSFSGIVPFVNTNHNYASSILPEKFYLSQCIVYLWG